MKKFISKPKKSPFLASWKSGFCGSEKNRLSVVTEKSIFRSRKNRDIVTTLKTIFRGPFFMATSKSDSFGYRKFAFSSRPERVIFGDKENRLFLANWKSDFFGSENRHFVATWKSDFSCYEKIDFSLRPDKAIYRGPKKICFSWRTEKAIFWGSKKSPWISDFSGTEKSLFSGNQ